MQCGCPVITSDISATAEIGGRAALLVDPTDTQALTEAISEVLASQTMGDNLTSEGLNRAQAFSWEKTARQTLEAYQQVATP
jgi:glycosyltransferase involved in cell wall biosynthesis